MYEGIISTLILFFLISLIVNDTPLIAIEPLLIKYFLNFALIVIQKVHEFLFFLTDKTLPISST